MIFKIIRETGHDSLKKRDTRQNACISLSEHSCINLSERYSTLTITESKTGKNNILVINKIVFKALKNYLDKIRPDDEDYLFPSRKGNSHLQSQAVSKLVKKWTKAINLKGNFGCHSLRKAWGFIQRTQYGVGFEIICKRYNHSSPAITMRYLGIQDREVHEVLMNEIG